MPTPALSRPMATPRPLGRGSDAEQRPFPSPPPRRPLAPRARLVALLGLAFGASCGERFATGLEPPPAPESTLMRVETWVQELRAHFEPGFERLLAGTGSPEDVLAPDFLARLPRFDDLEEAVRAATATGRLAVREAHLAPTDDANPLDGEACLARLREWPGPPAHAHLRLRSSEAEPDGSRLVADILLRLRTAGASATAGARRAFAEAGAPRHQLTLEGRAEFVRARAEAPWHLRRLDARRVEWIGGAPARFVDATARTGFDYHVSARNERLLQLFVDAQRTLALGGLSAVDWNRDGYWDLVATRDNQLAVLFLNDGHSGFVPTELPIRAPDECSGLFLLFDLDGDGRREIVGSSVQYTGGDRAELVLYTEGDDGWRRVPGALAFAIPRGLRRIAVQSLVPLDADGDGRLELFGAVYGDMLSRGEDYNTVEAHDGGRNLYFEQRGPLEFVETATERGLVGTQYTYVATAFDFDGDGDEDLWEGNDFGPNLLWKSDGAGGFERDTSWPFTGVRAYTMGVTIADYDSSGSWNLYVSNMSSDSGSRMCGIADDLSDPMRASARIIASGNRLYREADGWREHGEALGVAHCGWAWGAVFFDVENDGDQDLVVTNGFTTHSSQVDDWDPYYWRQVLADARFLEEGRRSEDVNVGVPFDGSFAGRQADRMFLFDGEPLLESAGAGAPRPSGRFHDVAWHLGLDSTHDGRAVIPVDVDGDGDLDLALWTLQGLRLFENRAPSRRFLRIELRATRSHPAALGAIVEVEAGGRTLRRRVRVIEGFQTQLPSDVHVGLGELDAIERLRVRWPSGAVDEFADVPLDRRLTIVEGRGDFEARELPRWERRASDPAPGTVVEHPELPPLAAEAAGRVLRIAGAPTEAGGTTRLVVAPLSAAPAGPGPGDSTSAAVASGRDDREASDEGAANPTPRGERGASEGVGMSDSSSADPNSSAPSSIAPNSSAPDAQAPGALDAESRESAELVIADALAQRWFGGPTRVGRTLIVDRDGLLVRLFERRPEASVLAAFAHQLADEPPFAGPLVEAGRAQLEVGRQREALQSFQEAARLYPDDPWAHEGVARAWLELGRPDLVEDAYRAAVAADPDYALAYFNLAVLQSQQGRLVEALANLDEALAIQPERIEWWLSRAEILSIAGRPAEAHEAVRAALAVDPDAAPAHLLEAKLHAAESRFTAARASLARVLELDPDNAEARRLMIRVEAYLQRQSD